MTLLLVELPRDLELIEGVHEGHLAVPQEQARAGLVLVVQVEARRYLLVKPRELLRHGQLQPREGRLELREVLVLVKALQVVVVAALPVLVGHARRQGDVVKGDLLLVVDVEHRHVVLRHRDKAEVGVFEVWVEALGEAEFYLALG